MSTFEERLISARKKSGMTQQQLAETMNVSRQTVSHWENGRVKPDEETLKQLSVFLKLEDEQALEQPEKGENIPSKKATSVVRAMIAFLCGILLTVLVVYGVLPLFTKQVASVPAQETLAQTAIVPADYPFEWYQQPAQNQEGKAYVSLMPDRSPVKLMPSNNPDREYMWNIVFFLEEVNEIPFTITKFTETYFNSEKRASAVSVKTGAECTRFWQTAMLEYGQGYGYNVYHTVDGTIGYGAAIEGIDANGNELAFGLYIPLSQEMEQVFTPAEFQKECMQETDKAYIEITPDNDPFPLIQNAEFVGGKGWEFLFTIENTSDVTFTLKQITQVIFGGEQVLDQKIFTADQTGIETLSKGDEPLIHNGGAGLPDVTGIGMMVEGTDANGNELSFVKYVAFAQE